jgi:OOP family OmpA-OmpF porin
VLLAAASLGFVADPVDAQEAAPADRFAPSFYVGAEAGATNFDNACDPTALSCDHTDSTGAPFLGYRFDSRFGLELGWRDLGEARATYPRLTSTIDVVGAIEGYDLSALMRFPLSAAWEAYVRAGAFRWDAQTVSPEFSAAESDWSPTAGAGFAWRFRPAWQMRFEYLYLDDAGGTETGETNVETLTVGLSYLFGNRVPQ